VEEVRDIVDLFLKSTEHASVPCVGEKSRWGALVDDMPFVLGM